MRTTITLDPDLDAKLRQLARERGLSFKAVVNLVLRRGLSDGKAGPGKPFRVEATALGLRPGIDFDKALTLAGELEDEHILEVMARADGEGRG